MRNRNVRGISDENWQWLRRVAAFEGVMVGQLLERIIEEWAAEWRPDARPELGSALVRRNNPAVPRVGSSASLR